MNQVIAIALIVLAACTPSTGPAPKPIPLDPEPTCEVYCRHMRALGCKQGKPTRRGATCEVVCENVRESVDFDLSCGYAARTCDEATACER